jgi:hypothetical protein
MERREETGRLPDGRHFKLFHLVDTTDGKECLAVRAEDSHRKDRRCGDCQSPSPWMLKGLACFPRRRFLRAALPACRGSLVPRPQILVQRTVAGRKVCWLSIVACKCRRYAYKADEAVGGFTFENGREVVDWLNFLVGKGPPKPTPPPQVRCLRQSHRPWPALVGDAPTCRRALHRELIRAQSDLIRRPYTG